MKSGLIISAVLAAVLAIVWAQLGAAAAQGTTINLSGGGYDGALPIEVTADRLSVDQDSGSATFEGDAVVGQGGLRLGADTLRIAYLADGGGVSQVDASGGVTFTNGSESAAAETAVYVVGDATITLIGNVVLIQGPNTISGDRLVLNLTNGTGAVEGNVKTVFTPKPRK